MNEYLSHDHMKPGALWSLTSREKIGVYKRKNQRAQRIVQYVGFRSIYLGVYYLDKNKICWCSYEDWIAWTAIVGAEFSGIYPERIIVTPPDKAPNLPEIGSVWKTKDNRYFEILEWQLPISYPFDNYGARVRVLNSKPRQWSKTFVPLHILRSFLPQPNYNNSDTVNLDDIMDVMEL